jgi:hypothetical protein
MTTAFRERYPGPWTIEELVECVRVVAMDGTILATIYREENQTRRALTNRVTLPEAQALAKAIAGLAKSGDR